MAMGSALRGSWPAGIRPFRHVQRCRRGPLSTRSLRAGGPSSMTASPGLDHQIREPCKFCGGQRGRVDRKGVQDCICCATCGKWFYNAPRSETGNPVAHYRTMASKGKVVSEKEVRGWPKNARGDCENNLAHYRQQYVRMRAWPHLSPSTRSKPAASYRYRIGFGLGPRTNGIDKFCTCGTGEAI